MNAASPDSKRLQRVGAYLMGGERSTLQIVRRCNVCAVNSIVSELRANGWTIICRKRKVSGVFRWFYLCTYRP